MKRSTVSPTWQQQTFAVRCSPLRALKFLQRHARLDRAVREALQDLVELGLDLGGDDARGVVVGGEAHALAGGVVDGGAATKLPSCAAWIDANTALSTRLTA